MRHPKLVRTIFALSVLSVVQLAAADDHPVVPLWLNGAPGSEARKDEPEKKSGSNVNNVHFPTLTVYLPAKEKATGAAVVVCPGGGHSNLAIQHEGYNVAQWLADHGIAAFILKYRLARDAANPPGTPQPYTVERDALADAQRAIRLVRSRAAEWSIRPNAVGIIGFSAGGELAALASTRYASDANAADPLDRLNAKPDFQGLIYPGQSQKIAPTKESPPAFLACGADDRPDISEGLANVYLQFKKAGVPVELHIYAGVGHGFGIRAERPTAAGGWPERFREWLVNRKFLAATSP